MVQITFTERDRGNDERCGTTNGWALHQGRGEKPCDACASAKAEYDRRWRAAPERTRINRLHAKAQGRALRALAKAHPDEYRVLYIQHKAALHAEFIRAQAKSDGAA